DFRYIQAIIFQNLTFSKQKILFTGGGVDEKAMLDRLLTYLEQFDNHEKQLLKEKNFAAIINLHTLFSIGRNKEFLGKMDDDGSFNELAYEVMKFNRFRMSMEIEFKVESETIIASGTLKAVNDFYVSLAPEDKKFQLFATNTKYLNDEEGKYYVPLKITGGHKDQKEEDDKWVPYEYTGPEDVISVFPIVRMSFCNDEIDSVYLSIFRYRDDNYMDKAGRFPKAYTIDFIGWVNLLSMDPEGAEASVKGGIEIAGNLMRISNLTVASKGNAIIDKWRTNEAKMLEGRRQGVNFSKLAVSNKAILTFDANTSGDVLFTAETNITQDGDFALKKGLVRIKVVHDPVKE
ncbi:MAG TPA: hypothetical protein VJT83_08490, partial [Chitinophagaceae bacterium]|nr:hypothetical protein [Chitinophagaceae bacterium]